MNMAMPSTQPIKMSAREERLLSMFNGILHDIMQLPEDMVDKEFRRLLLAACYEPRSETIQAVIDWTESNAGGIEVSE